MSQHRPDHEIELYRTGDAFEVVADLDGFDREDVDLRWHDRRLSIVAEHGEGGESRTRLFNQEVSVPRAVDESGIAAEFADGVLEVRLPIADADEDPESGQRIDVAD